MQAALPYLNEAHSNQKGEYYGRMTRPVACFLLAKLFLNIEIYTDNDWTDENHPDGKAYQVNIGSQTLNAWQAVQAYCDSIRVMGYKLSSRMVDNFVVYNEPSEENIFTIPMDKHALQNQMQYLFRSRHYNHAKAYGLSGENGPSATIEALETFGYGTAAQDPRFDICYFAGECMT